LAETVLRVEEIDFRILVDKVISMSRWRFLAETMAS
jgi:hypothetical protein